MSKLADALRQTADCLEDVANGKGGWAWEEVLQEARAALAADGWQPIETAPKSGAIVLGWYAGTVSAMCWHDEKYYRFGGVEDAKAGWAVHGPGLMAWTAKGKPMIFEPTHWQPRPASPQEKP